VDVVAHAGAVGGRVVGAEDVEVRPLANGHLLDERHQVVRDALRILADLPRRVGSDRVKVAQQAHVPSIVGRGHVAKDELVHELRLAVRVRRARRELLRHRHCRRVAVHGRRRREDDVAAAGLVHHLDEVEGALDVDLVVEERLRDRLANRFQPREVDHRVDLVLREELAELGLVTDVDLVEGGLASGERLHAAEALKVGIAQVVGYDDVVALLQQLEHRVAANVAHAASDEHCRLCRGAAGEAEERAAA